MISHPTGLRINLLREIPDDPALREQWNNLVLRTHNPQVFYTYEWARAVQLAYGESLCSLLVLAYNEDQQLVGVAALAAPSGNPVSFLCATTGDYCDFVVSEQDAAVFAGRVLETLRQQGFRDIVLTNFPQDSPSYAALWGATVAAGFHRYTRVAYECVQVRLSAMVSPAGKLALPRQKMVRRSLRVMSEVAPLTMTHGSSWDEVRSRLPEFFRAHVARFLFTDRISNMLRPERRRFLSELARLLSSTGWLCLTRLNVGARTVSWNYGFMFCGTWFLYQPTFVNDLEKYSPGFVLLSKLIEDAAQNSAIETVDLGLGAESYKQAFANGSRRTMYVTLHRSRLKHWKERARHGAVRVIAAWPRMEQTARNLVAKAAALRGRLGRSGLKGTLAWVLSRTGRWLFSRKEILFFEGVSGSSGSYQDLAQDFALRPVSYELLAQAAMESYDDDQTLQYLLRCARRLREGKAEGFALVDSEGQPVHFAWATAFDGFFLAELDDKVEAPSPDAALLFDCWTPQVMRGRGYHCTAMALLAKRISSSGKRPWTFSVGADPASVGEIEKAGFQRRYSLVRQRILGLQSIKGQPPLSPKASPAEVSVHV